MQSSLRFDIFMVALTICCLVYPKITNYLEQYEEQHDWWRLQIDFEGDEKYYRMDLYDLLGSDGYIHFPFSEFTDKLKNNEYSYYIFEIVQEEGYVIGYENINSYNDFLKCIFNEYDIIDTNYDRIVVATTYHLHQRYSKANLSMQDFADNLLDSTYRHNIYNELINNKIKGLGTFERFEHYLEEDKADPLYMEVDRKKALLLYLMLSKNDDMPLDFKQFYYCLTKYYYAEEIYISLLEEFGNEYKCIIGNTMEEFINYITNG